MASNVLPPPIETGFPTASESVLEADEELDEVHRLYLLQGLLTSLQISRKLNKIHNKIGNVSGGSARAAEQLGSGNIQVRGSRAYYNIDICVDSLV